MSANVPTPHIAAKIGEIAPKVLMPGDPLRAKFIAEAYLTDTQCVNTTRNMLAYTGRYKGSPITVMGSGMGMPSIGIYSYELFNFYEVEEIIRIGSAGAILEDLDLYDVVIGMGACTNSNFGSQFGLPGIYAPIASFDLLSRAVKVSEGLGIPVHVGNILSSDVFYEDLEATRKWQRMGVLAVEMEAAALYMNAARAGRKALTIVTISDCPLREKPAGTTAGEREKSFQQMMEIALNT